jgi:hypothetical protein
LAAFDQKTRLEQVMEGCAMVRYPTEQLMTVEEAERLSELHTGRTRRKQQPRQPSLWVWQSVSGALEQTVTEAQVDEMMRQLRSQDR